MTHFSGTFQYHTRIYSHTITVYYLNTELVCIGHLQKKNKTK